MQIVPNIFGQGTRILQNFSKDWCCVERPRRSTVGETDQPLRHNAIDVKHLTQYLAHSRCSGNIAIVYNQYLTLFLFQNSISPFIYITSISPSPDPSSPFIFTNVMKCFPSLGPLHIVFQPRKPLSLTLQVNGSFPFITGSHLDCHSLSDHGLVILYPVPSTVSCHTYHRE